MLPATLIPHSHDCSWAIWCWNAIWQWGARRRTKPKSGFASWLTTHQQHCPVCSRRRGCTNQPLAFEPRRTQGTCSRPSTILHPDRCSLSSGKRHGNQYLVLLVVMYGLSLRHEIRKLGSRNVRNTFGSSSSKQPLSYSSQVLNDMTSIMNR